MCLVALRPIFKEGDEGYDALQLVSTSYNRFCCHICRFQFIVIALVILMFS